MNRTTTLIAFLFLYLNSFSQQSTFSKVYYELSHQLNGHMVEKTIDGGAFICGRYDYMSAFLKVDSLGVIQWAKKLGFSFDESVNALVRTNDSCFVMGGKIYDSNAANFDLFFAKVDQNGNVLWTKSIAEPDYQQAMSMSLTSDGGFIVTGHDISSSGTISKILVLKLDANGDVQWYNDLSAGNNSNYGTSVAETPDGDFILQGHFENFPPYQGYGFLSKITSTGSIAWTNTYTTPNGDALFGASLVLTPTAIYSYHIVQGTSAVLKVDYDGIDIWKEKIYTTYSSQSCLNCPSPKMKMLANGNLALVNGTRENVFGPSNLIVIDTNGTFKWSQDLSNSVIDLVENDDHSFYYLGNGPLIGVRTTTITDPQIGLNRADSLGNSSLCTFISQNVSVTFGGINKGTSIFASHARSVNSLSINPPVTDLVLSNIVGCVDIIGGVNELEKQQLEVYPNPACQSFKIKADKLTGDLKIEIKNVLGEVVYLENLVNATHDEITLSPKLSNGFYIVSVTSKDKELIGKVTFEN